MSNPSADKSTMNHRADIELDCRRARRFNHELTTDD